MTPMQRFIPGLGQPLDFAAMAAGQGGMNPLAEALGGYRQQNTLAAAPTIGNAQAQQAQAQQQAQSLAAMMEAYKSAQGDQQLAQELMRPEYARDSGALGALAMIAQTYAGRKMSKKADESASQYADRIFAEEQRMAQEQAAKEAAAKEAELARQWAREDKRDETKAQREERLAMLRIDAADRRTAQSAEARVRAAQIAASGQGDRRNPIADKIANAEAALGRPLSDAERSALAGVPAASRSGGQGDAPSPAIAGLAEDALSFAAAYTGKSIDDIRRMTPEEVRTAVAGGGRTMTGPILGRLPGSGAMFNADLEAYSNAAAGKQARLNNPTGPVSNADFDIGRKSVWSAEKPDDVNADLIYQALVRAQPAAPQPAPSAPASGGPKAGEVVDGYRFKGGDPGNPASWERI